MQIKAVLRFWYEGRLVEPGEEFDIDESAGREVTASGKAVRAELAAVAPVEADAPDEPAADGGDAA